MVPQNPDPALEKARQRIILPGDVPSPGLARAGCPFQDRCRERMDVCREHTPRLREAGPGHQVACFLYHAPD